MDGPSISYMTDLSFHDGCNPIFPDDESDSQAREGDSVHGVVRRLSPPVADRPWVLRHHLANCQDDFLLLLLLLLVVVVGGGGGSDNLTLRCGSFEGRVEGREPPRGPRGLDLVARLVGPLHRSQLVVRRHPPRHAEGGAAAAARQRGRRKLLRRLLLLLLE